MATLARLCVALVVLASVLARVSATAVPPRSLAFASFTNPGAVWSLVNGATFVDGTLRLNADEPNASPAAWYPSKLWMDQFNVTVLFSIKAGSSSSNGGLALVIQSDRVGKSGANDAGLGYGMTPTDAGDGISSSLAVEFDTILDAGVDDTMPDCEPPHISVHTMGNTANSAVEKAARIGCWNSMLNPYSNTSVVHNITLSYSNNLLHVRFDNIGPVVISTEINLVTKLGLNDSLAWLGFTASTGPAGGDVHTIEALFYEYYSNLAPARSTFSGLVSVPAGQLQNVTVNAVDEFGHPYPYGGSALTVALRNATTTQFTYHVFDFANGTYTIQWSSTYAVNDSMVIQMDGADISGSPAAVEVTPLAVEPAQCNTTGSVTYGEAGTVSSFSIHVFDKYRNPTPSTVTFAGSTLQGPPGAITIDNLDPPVPGNGVGVWDLSFKPAHVGHYTWNLLANGVAIGFQPPALHVAHGPPNAANCIVNGAPTSFVVGNEQRFSVSLFDADNNIFTGDATVVATMNAPAHQPPLALPVACVTDREGDFNCTYTITAAAVYTLSVTVNGAAIPNANGIPAATTAQSAPVSPADSAVLYSGQPLTVEAGAQVTTTLLAVDHFQNPITGVVDWAVATNGVARTPTPALPPPGNSAGQWSISWRPQVANTYTVTATIGGVAVQNSGVYTVVVTSLSTADPKVSVVSGAGVTKAHAGVPAKIWVQPKDSFGNVVKSGAAVNCTITRNVATPSASDYVPVTSLWDAGNTTWVFTYTPPSGGQYLLSLTISGALWNGVPQVINVEGGGMAPGIIAAIVLSIVAAIALVVGVVFIIRRRNKKYQSI